MAALVATANLPALAQKVPCSKVLRRLNTAELKGDVRGADPRRVAIALGTSEAWVERCAAVYGRRLRLDSDEVRHREDYDPKWESDEVDETSREELETSGDVAYDPNPYRDKARQRAFLRNRRDWVPFEHTPWEPNTGHEWSPYIDDPMRMLEDDGMGRVPRVR